INILIARNRKLEIQDYWSTNELLHQNIFDKLMIRDGYLLLLRLIHFCNKSQQVHGDRLYKIQMVISEVQTNFKDALIAFSNLAIDKSLLLWKD
ncbi:PiggyBac transposable element-derived protein, partial [Cinara cedri]